MTSYRIPANVDDYGFYQIINMMLNMLYSSQSLKDFNFAGLVFTNVLATNQVVFADKLYVRLNTQVDYVLTAAFPQSLYDLKGQRVNTLSGSVPILAPLAFANSAVTVTSCYTWNDLFNDDAKNNIVMSLEKVGKYQPNSYFFDKFGNTATYFNQENRWTSNFPSQIINDTLNPERWNFVYFGSESTLSKTGYYDTTLYVPAAEKYSKYLVWEPDVFKSGKINSWQAISYMQRKISLVLFVHHGTIIFTASSSLNWRPSFYVWVISAIGKEQDPDKRWQYKDHFYYNCYRINLDQNDYWFADGSENPHIEHYNLFPTLLESVQYLYSSSSSPTGTLALITAKGIYTIAGDNNWLFNNVIYKSDTSLGNLFDIYSKNVNGQDLSEFPGLGPITQSDVKNLDNQILCKNLWTDYSNSSSQLLVAPFALPIADNFLYVLGSGGNNYGSSLVN